MLVSWVLLVQSNTSSTLLSLVWRPRLWATYVQRSHQVDGKSLQQMWMEKPNTETFHCLLLWQVFCGNGAMTSYWWLGLSGGLSKINQSSQALKTHLHLGLWKSATNVNGKPNTETFHCLLLWQVFCGNGAMTSYRWLGLSGGLSKINQSSQALKTHLHLGLWKSATNVNGKPNTETFHCLLLWQVFCGNGARWLGLSGGLSAKHWKLTYT